jgi:hypothetical protein
VDAERSLFASEVLDSAVAAGAVAAVLTAVGGVWVGTRAMRAA